MNIPTSIMPQSRRSSGEILTDKIKSKPCATQDGSRLLGLPAELRNMIYEYVMYRPGGIKFVVQNRRISQDDNVDPVEVRAAQDNSAQGNALNPLKLVCRQLYIETLGLLLKSNDVHFSCGLETNLKTRRYTLSSFIDQCEPYKLAALRKVTIDISGCQFVTDPFLSIKLVKLLQRISKKICANNPRITVFVRDDWWDTDEYGKHEWIKWVFGFQEGLRNKSTISVLDPVRRGTLMLKFQTFLKSRVKHEPISENCRLTISSYFPEDDVRWEAQNWYAGLLNEEENIATTMGQARKAFEDGI